MIKVRDSLGEVQQGAKLCDWTILGKLFRLGGKRWHVVARCACGAVKALDARSILNGDSPRCKSCGKRIQSTKHGGVGTRLYGVWASMKRRCDTPSASRYESYGGRGIAVCDEWATDFSAFRDWAIASGYGIGKSIDRINNDGNYEPANCRWVTADIQQMNRRVTLRLTAYGETKTVPEWLADGRCVVGDKLLRGRIDKGWGHEVAISTPANGTANYIAAFGESKRLVQWASDPRCAVSRELLKYRLCHGWDAELAITKPSRPRARVGA